MMLAVDNKQSLPCNVILNALHHLLFGGLTENILYSVINYYDGISSNFLKSIF